MPIRLDKNQRRKLSIFAKCLLFSFLAWALFAISNTYTISKLVGLEYINSPENRAFRPIQSDSARVRVEASGWHLLFSSLTEEAKVIQVDLSGLTNRDFIVIGNQLGFINRQFPNNERVVAVLPDTLFFDFARQGQKQVPVRVQHQLNFAKQFGLTGPIKANPAKVNIRGPVDDLKGIEYIETDTIRASQVNSTLTRTVSVFSKNHANISVYPKAVEVVIPIGELTEKELEIPIDVINGDQYRSVKLLPNKVRVTLLVSLQAYSAVDADQIRAVVDMREWIPSERSTLAVKIEKLPAFCKLVKISPQNVDFFVNK